MHTWAGLSSKLRINPVVIVRNFIHMILQRTSYYINQTLKYKYSFFSMVQIHCVVTIIMLVFKICLDTATE